LRFLEGTEYLTNWLSIQYVRESISSPYGRTFLCYTFYMPEPESFDLNNQSRSTDAVPTIPTSTSEVAVRTMASDIELMGQSGGMTGQTQTQSRQQVSTPQAPQTAQAPQGMHVPVTLHPDEEAAVEAPSGGRGKMVLITIVVIVVALGLFSLGYFVL
jgi:hypothetical protein